MTLTLLKKKYKMKQKKVWISDIDEENQTNVLSKSKSWLKMALMCLILNSCISSYEIVIKDFYKGIENGN
mgnify:CR=1 FL=1